MTRTSIDQMGRDVLLPAQPKRIISLVPSQTELLYSLGLKEEVVGITKFCIHPEHWYRSKKRIGGTKNVNKEAVQALNPDLIIGNKEENTRADIEALASEYPVWMSDIQTLEGALEMIEKIGALVNCDEKAQELAKKISETFIQLQPIENPKKVLYLIWNKPFMAAGKNTFIDSMLIKCGLQNAVAHDMGRYPEVSIEWMSQQSIDHILLSSEPFPFKEKHVIELEKAMPDCNAQVVDGELFSWYGSRLLKSPEYFSQLISAIERP